MLLAVEFYNLAMQCTIAASWLHRCPVPHGWIRPRSRRPWCGASRGPGFHRTAVTRCMVGAVVPHHQIVMPGRASKTKQALGSRAPFRSRRKARASGTWPPFPPAMGGQNTVICGPVTGWVRTSLCCTGTELVRSASCDNVGKSQDAARETSSECSQNEIFDL